MESSQDFVLICPLCKQPVSLTSDNCADENGTAMHEHCYARYLAERNSSPKPKVA
jgi:hypothetical protein